MHAATQQQGGTIAPSGAALHGLREGRGLTGALTGALAGALTGATASRSATLPMIQHKPRQLLIQGVTTDGRTFRPSAWAERLAGAMSCFRPGGSAGGIASFIGYSPYCEPRIIDEVKCVIVSEALKDIEPMAWDFVMSFARDNQLQLSEACLLPDATQS